LTRILITGGAGFVGANLAVSLAESHPDWQVISLDNLHRRGSEMNLPRLGAAGVEFARIDVRDRAALRELAGVDAIVECSAEPSALVGMSGDGDYAFETNLVGAYNCLELARASGAQLIFLSTSRVYPYTSLARLSLERGPTRFSLTREQPVAGAGPAGISEAFPLEGARTLYGATKLSAELLIREYSANFGLATAINRCGVIAGPWQMGRVDQGVFTYWLLQHHRARPLTYIGFGGTGLQVRDLLHVDDLIALIESQLADPVGWDGWLGNVGGGPEISLSLQEATAICRELTGNEVPIDGGAEERPGDVPLYISDMTRLYKRADWRPTQSAQQILEHTYEWVVAYADEIDAAMDLEA